MRFTKHWDLVLSLTYMFPLLYQKYLEIHQSKKVHWLEIHLIVFYKQFCVQRLHQTCQLFPSIGMLQPCIDSSVLCGRLNNSGIHVNIVTIVTTGMINSCFSNFVIFYSSIKLMCSCITVNSHCSSSTLQSLQCRLHSCRFVTLSIKHTYLQSMFWCVHLRH